ncbi:MAG: NAD(P)/FAD-dependent oxidoreductase [Bacillota bacterium]|nr:NAD(P)/FAD-dependent oxidoreductase [Bacillota bacterium]
MAHNLLAAEGKIGNMILKNRVVMPAMGTGLGTIHGEVSSQMIRYYEERARGGAGMIIVELASVDSPGGRASLTQLRIDRPEFVSGLNELTDAIHSYGCKAMIQLHHAGRQTVPAITDGIQPVAPSPIACKFMKAEPMELSVEQIRALEKKFVIAAVLASKAGFDGVELHAAHGYLLSQFLSPYSNTRTDEYGGSTENRARILVEIIQGIKSKVPGLAVGVRLNIVDFVPEGLQIEEGVQLAEMIEKAGADVINVSGGIYESGQTTIEPASFKEGWRIYLAEAVKKKVKIPTIAGGVIRDPRLAEELIAQGKTDFVWVGRGMIADPFWTKKAIEGKADQIRPCLSCNHCIGRSFAGMHIKCVVNPYATQEWRFDKRPQLSGKRVFVVGGGPAGMQAALSLCEAGCQVELFEQSEQLGGVLPIASVPPNKERVGLLLEYLVHQVNQSDIELHLQTPFSVEQMEQGRPDAVIVAVGAREIIPVIPGVETARVVSTEDILKQKEMLSEQKVAIIGGGTTACELAEYLIDQKNEVTIIEQRKHLAAGLENMTRLDLLMRLKKKGIISKTMHCVKNVHGKEINLQSLRDQTEQQIEVDVIVNACGYQSDHSLFEALKDAGYPLCQIGDAAKVGGIETALRDGVMVAYQIMES